MKTTATMKRFALVLGAGAAALTATATAGAQEILVTGPLAGAPAVRKLRLYREGRFEVAPSVSFTLLDEYKRTIMPGLRVNYNITDWLAVGVFGGFAGVDVLQGSTGLTDEIQRVNEQRRNSFLPDGRDIDNDGDLETYDESPDGRLTATNLGPEFPDQVATQDWMAAPQITLVPFRGKIALFASLYVDTDLYFFGGPAFVGVSERGECGVSLGLRQCSDSFETESRVAITGTFGLGLTFYVNKWNAVGLEWRAYPFAMNSGGFDSAGAGPNEEFPDNAIDDRDRQFRFNQMLTLSWNFYFPLDYRISE